LPDVTLPQLVQNGTMDEHIAALLWTIAEEKRWIVSAAVPRKAGKSTALHAALQFVPEGTPVHHMSGDIEEIRSFASSPDGGYLEVGEISTEPPARYIWGEPVAALFETLSAGFSLATTMHAADPTDLFQQICEGNGISDADASKIECLVFAERFGESDETYWRRVTGVFEVHGVKNGAPDVTKLHEWDRSNDTFTALAYPARLAASPDTLAARAEAIRRLADAERVSSQEVDALIGRELRTGGLARR
jgi:hypothetical protein